MKTIVAFGEVMARLAAPGHLRLRQAHQLELSYAGSEASVAASICNFGGAARYVTALPKHDLAEATIDALRAVGMDTRYVVRTDRGRLGVYFLETGANQRPSNVIYDRADSSVAITAADRYDWESAFSGADWLHLSGITPALSKIAAESTMVAAKKAKNHGLPVSLDLNFRGKLWTWDGNNAPRALAQKTMRTILPYVDLLIANEEDCQDVLGIRAADSDVHQGTLDVSRYSEVAQQVTKQFPNISKVAVTLRESLSATHNRWGGMLYDANCGEPSFSPLNAAREYRAYEIKNIVDRVGAGDAFAGGLVFGLLTPELAAPQTALDFAVAASCLKHSIRGDVNYSSRREIESLMGGSASGRVVR